jgi:hypothetical protein
MNAKQSPCPITCPDRKHEPAEKAVAAQIGELGKNDSQKSISLQTHGRRQICFSIFGVPEAGTRYRQDVAIAGSAGDEEV